MGLGVSILNLGFLMIAFSWFGYQFSSTAGGPRAVPDPLFFDFFHPNGNMNKSRVTGIHSLACADQSQCIALVEINGGAVNCSILLPAILIALKGLK